MPAKAPLRPTVFPPKYRFMKLLVMLLGMLVIAPLSEELCQVRALGDF
jgi:membrane protease YdiL (CAAX protease family)